jgi:hypothetical protein
MIGALGRGMPVLPDVRRSDVAKRALALQAARFDDHGQFVDGGGTMSRLADEACVLGVRDGLDGEKDVVDVNAVDGSFVVLRIIGAHQKLTAGNQRKLGSGVRHHSVVSRE